MLKTYAFGISLALINSLSAYGTENIVTFDKFPDDALGQISAFLSPKEATRLRLLNSKTSCLENNILQENLSPYGVKLSDGNWHFFQRVIQDDRLYKIMNFNCFNSLGSNLNDRSVTQPLSQFMIQRILADTTAIMSEDATIEGKLAKLKAYHQSLVPVLMCGIYNDLSAEAAKAALIVGSLVEAFVETRKIESQVIDQVKIYDWAAVNSQVMIQVMSHVRAQVGAKTIAQVGNQVLGQAGDEIMEQVLSQSRTLDNSQVEVQARAQVRAHIKAQIEAQLAANLSYLSMNNASNFAAGEFKNALKPTIEYIFTVSQLVMLALRYSPEFKTWEGGYLEAGSALDVANIVIPENTRDHLIDTQLMLLRKIKASYLQAMDLENTE